MSPCIVCGSTAHSPYHTKKNFTIFTCEECGLLRVHPLPTKEQLDACYSEGYFTGGEECDGYMDYDFEKEVTRKTFEHHLERMEAHRPLGELFEIGAATGYFLGLAAARGWQVSGVDYSAYAAERARARGLAVTAGGVEVLQDQSARYDVIALFDVIEHLLYPEQEIATIVGAIKPGGLLVFATPDRSSFFARMVGKYWHAIVPPQHVFLYGSKQVAPLLSRYGCAVLEISHPGKRFTVPYFFRALYSWLGFRFLYRLAEWTARRPFGKVSFPLNLGDTMFVVAQKEVL